MLAEERFNRILNIVEEKKKCHSDRIDRAFGYFRVYDTKGSDNAG